MGSLTETVFALPRCQHAVGKVKSENFFRQLFSALAGNRVLMSECGEVGSSYGIMICTYTYICTSYLNFNEPLDGKENDCRMSALVSAAVSVCGPASTEGR